MTISQLPWTYELVGPLGTSAYIRDAKGDKVAFVLDIRNAEAIVNANTTITNCNKRIEKLEDRLQDIRSAIVKSVMIPQGIEL